VTITWPNVTMIGKADDDIWLQPEGVVMHLHLSLKALQLQYPSSQPPLLYWGFMQSYHWHEKLRLPVPPFNANGYGYHRKPQPCSLYTPKGYKVNRTQASDYRMWGPFPFAIGGAFFLSSALVRQLVAATTLQTLLAEAIDDASLKDRNKALKRLRLARGSIIPWDDVWVGLALTRIVENTTQLLAAVHIGDAQFSDGWTRGLRRSTLVFHAGGKWRSSAMKQTTWMHRWATAQHCNVPMALRCKRTRYDSCTHARWRLCSHDTSVAGLQRGSDHASDVGGGFGGRSAPPACNVSRVFTRAHHLHEWGRRQPP